MTDLSAPTTVLDAPGDATLDGVTKALSTIRDHLGMEIAYLSEFVDDRSVFRALDAPALGGHVKVGDSNAIKDVYCQHILDGRLPNLIPDTSLIDFAGKLPITKALPIGSHMSLPIRRPDGSVYGMFCCLSSKPNPTLNDRDLATMEMFAQLATEHVHREDALATDRAAIRARVEGMLASRDFTIVYQPIWDLWHNRIGGFESLCRFHGPDARTPDVWFDEAATIGLGVELEILVAGHAVRALERLKPDIRLSVNASPDTILSGRLEPLFADSDASRLTVEITEHAVVEDYGELLIAFEPLRARGIKLSVDDAGAGYASLRHIVRLAPEVIKLDMSLTRNIDSDPALRSLAGALIHFGRETKAVIVAEGIETEAEMKALRQMRVFGGQGYHLGKPGPVPQHCLRDDAKVAA